MKDFNAGYGLLNHIVPYKTNPFRTTDTHNLHWGLGQESLGKTYGFVLQDGPLGWLSKVTTRSFGKKNIHVSVAKTKIHFAHPHCPQATNPSVVRAELYVKLFPVNINY